ncbi:MAG: glycosyltransferase family 4 protein [Planctomycetaceae bacterium]|nr:glycosyltransferase family 4 protein [Planctomycetaceae bacterium]
MRIAIAFEFASLNGGEQSMLAVVDSLRGTGAAAWEFVGLAPPEGPLADALRKRGIRLVPLVLQDKAGRRFPPDVSAGLLREAAVEAAADVLHANSLSLARLTGRLAARQAAAGALSAGQALPVCTGHLRDMLRLSGAAMRDLAGNHCLVAVSGATAGYHIARGLPADKVRILHNGVDLNRFRPRPDAGELRRQLRADLGISETAAIALTVGQIGLRKGLDVLASAAALLAEAVPQLHFVIVGQRFSAKEETRQWEQSVRATFETGGLAGRTHWPGWRDDLPELMNGADLLVHPALQEPLGRVLLEAAACGLPIVATRVGGTAEILRDGNSALLVPPGDREQLTGAIRDLVAEPELRKQFALNGRRRIEADFSVGLAAGRLGAFWREMYGACR